MDLTRAYIDGLSFTVKKDKYYLGYEVDQALDDIAAGVDALNGQIAEYHVREEKMIKAIQYYQNLERQRAAEPAVSAAEKEQLAAAQAQIAHLKLQLQQAQQMQQTQPAAATTDDEKLRLAARAERTLAEFKATREHLIAELTALQTKKDTLKQEIATIAAAAADHIMALAKPEEE